MILPIYLQEFVFIVFDVNFIIMNKNNVPYTPPPKMLSLTPSVWSKTILIRCNVTRTEITVFDKKSQTWAIAHNVYCQMKWNEMKWNEMKWNESSINIKFWPQNIKIANICSNKAWMLYSHFRRKWKQFNFDCE